MRTKPQSRQRKMSWAGRLSLLAVIILCCCSQKAAAQQWTTNGNDISNANTGNVGIGTTTPGYTLTLTKNYNGPTVVATFNTTNGASAQVGGVVSRTTDISSRFLSWGVTAPSFSGAGYGETAYLNTSGVPFKFGTLSAHDLLFFTGGISNTRMTITGGGNVGIGTTSPQRLMHVTGAIRVGSNDLGLSPGGIDFLIRNANANTATLLRVSPNGNGGSYPAILQVFETDYNVDQTNYIEGKVGFLNSAFVIETGKGGTGAQRPMLFSINDSEKMRLDGNGNVGIGTTSPAKKLDVAGDINASGAITGGNIQAKYQDVAEWVESSQELPPGTVVVLDHTKSNQVIASSQAYDTRVAGVISERPGITLGEGGDKKVLVATTGRVRITVDASQGPIQIGDLLVTSDIPGVAMKSQPINVGDVQIHRPGTIIGKALEPLAKGSGEILVLLSLQ